MKTYVHPEMEIDQFEENNGLIMADSTYHPCDNADPLAPNDTVFCMPKDCGGADVCNDGSGCNLVLE